MTDAVSAQQIKSYVDRILRLKEDERAIKDDIKEVYGEAKSNGWDKTELGRLVAYVIAEEKDSAKLAERNAIFELYLEAYHRASHTHAPARDAA